MEEYTWIGLPRCFTTVSFYKDSRCILLFCYLLLKAEREDSWLGKSITKRGEINISSRKLETILGMSRQNIRAALSKLQEERAIFCECKKGKTSKIAITNFDKFLSIYNYEGGWIKLYDDFTGQRWFYNPFLFHLYLHINLKLIQDKVYNGNPAWLEVENLSLETGIVPLEIKRTLRRMNKLGLIVLDYKNNNISTVLLPKYTSFKEKKKALFLEDKNNPLPTHFQPTSNPLNFTESSQSDNEDVFISGCNIDTCDVSQPTSNPLPTHFQLTEFHREFTECSPDENRLAHARIKVYNKINMNNENKKENKNTSTASREYSSVNIFNARERLFFDNLVENHIWIKSVQNRFHISTSQEVMSLLNDFLSENAARLHEGHKDLKDFVNHFCDWKKKVLKERAVQEEKENNHKDIKDEIRRAIPTSAFDENGNNIYEADNWGNHSADNRKLY